MDISTVRIAGPQRITWKGIDMGHTLDGVLFRYEREFEAVTVDKYGSMPIDQVLVGSNLQVVFKLAQDTIRTWDMAVPESSSYDGATQDRADFGVDAGYSARTDAGLLVIHPLSRATGDLTEDIQIYLAHSIGSPVEVPFRINEVKAVEITMGALVSEQFASGRRLGHIGYAAVS